MKLPGCIKKVHLDLRDCARLHRNEHSWGNGGENHEQAAHSARPLLLLHMPQHIQHWGCSLECLSTCLVCLSYRLTGARGSALTDGGPATAGGRGRWSGTLPRGSTPRLTVICSTRLPHPILWLVCDGERGSGEGKLDAGQWRREKKKKKSKPVFFLKKKADRAESGCHL